MTFPDEARAGDGAVLNDVGSYAGDRLVSEDPRPRLFLRGDFSMASSFAMGCSSIEVDKFCTWEGDFIVGDFIVGDFIVGDFIVGDLTSVSEVPRTLCFLGYF